MELRYLYNLLRNTDKSIGLDTLYFFSRQDVCCHHNYAQVLGTYLENLKTRKCYKLNYSIQKKLRKYLVSYRGLIMNFQRGERDT